MDSTFTEEMQYAASLDKENAARVLRYVCGTFTDVSAELPTKLNAIHEMLSAYMREPTTENCSDISHEQFYNAAGVVFEATKLMVDLSTIYTLCQAAKRDVIAKNTDCV